MTYCSRTFMKSALAIVVFALSPSIARAKDKAAAQEVKLTPDQLKWSPIPALQPGAEWAFLSGNPTKKGPYVYRVKLPPRFQLQPHSHSDNRNYTVISGAYYEAKGDKFDEAKLEPYPPGTFSTYTAGQKHYSETKDDEVLLQVSGNGPTVFTYVNPADDPRKKK